MRPFTTEKPLIGMVHLLPTPLAPKSDDQWDMNTIVDQALKDARTLGENGADGILVENYNDIPFYPPTHSYS